MRKRVRILGLLLALAMIAPAFSQPPIPVAAPNSQIQVPIYSGNYPPPQIPTAPLLYLRLAGPKGMKVTFFRNQREQEFPTPCVIGVRPGYGYRMMLSGIPNLPAAVFFPTLEVHGSLYMGKNLRNADFPATIHFTEEELLRADAGAHLKKLLVLERPEKATPIATKPEDPLEFSLPLNRNVLEEARDKGHLLAVIQLGQRKYAREDLIQGCAPGTLLLPDEKVITAPQAAPWLEWKCYPLADPLLGPENPANFYCLPDGGDTQNPVGFRNQQLVGLDPSDTVAEYQDSKGRRKIAVSNRVCLCVPRYILFKQEFIPSSHVAQFNPANSLMMVNRSVFDVRQGPITQQQRMSLETTNLQMKSSSNFSYVSTIATGSVASLNIRASISNVRTLDGSLVCERSEPDVPLVIIKWPDKCGALVGDIVTFYLRFSNQGRQPITNVIVSDNLIPRFEYVAGTAKADRDAIFTIEPNDVGSSILRWEVRGTLQPGESGLIRFQIKVR